MEVSFPDEEEKDGDVSYLVRFIYWRFVLEHSMPRFGLYLSPFGGLITVYRTLRTHICIYSKLALYKRTVVNCGNPAVSYLLYTGWLLFLSKFHQLFKTTDKNYWL